MTVGIERPTLPLSSVQLTILMKPSCGDYLMATLSVEVDIGCKHIFSTVLSGSLLTHWCFVCYA